MHPVPAEYTPPQMGSRVIIGLETALAIAPYANLLIITGYNSERYTPDTNRAISNIRCLLFDLSSLAAVRKAAEEVNATKTYIPRVVFLSSIWHEHAHRFDFADLEHPDPEKYKPLESYSQAKSAVVLLAAELSRRSQGAIHGYSVSPGVAFTNFQQKPEAFEAFFSVGIINFDGTPNLVTFNWKTLPQSAATTLVAAFGPGLAAKPGIYLDDCNEAPIAGSNISDPDLPAQLWSLMEKITGERFEFSE
ncbi:hypothetical protein B0H17DRAFT_1195419 [Mycena rosella]|uniref:Uncharacterized protein n=1 Tax=Mycena rosella TaxID=1033263 RepID=A0AAD7DW33_MYCRO|nr:hypothetical protein B0H17DRAFT_1195419 [Mycena rosella]